MFWLKKEEVGPNFLVCSDCFKKDLKADMFGMRVSRKLKPDAIPEKQKYRNPGRWILKREKERQIQLWVALAVEIVSVLPDQKSPGKLILSAGMEVGWNFHLINCKIFH